MMSLDEFGIAESKLISEVGARRWNGCRFNFQRIMLELYKRSASFAEDPSNYRGG